MRRALSCSLAILLAVLLAVPASAARAGPPPSETGDRSAKSLNVRAQRLLEQEDYAGAGEAYAQIFEVLPENRGNRQERDNTLLIALEVFREAYRRERAGGGDRVRGAAQHLCRGKRVYETYRARYRTVYGSGAEPSPAALQSFQTLTAMIAEVEAELDTSVCGPPPPPEVAPRPAAQPLTEPDAPAEPAPAEAVESPPRRSGVGMLVGGAVVAAAGMGTISLVIIGVNDGGRAERDAANIERELENEALSEDDRAVLESRLDQAQDDEREAQVKLVAGAVSTAVLLAAGTTLIVLGARRKLRSMALRPQLGPGYVGVGVGGRF